MFLFKDDNLDEFVHTNKVKIMWFRREPNYRHFMFWKSINVRFTSKIYLFQV